MPTESQPENSVLSNCQNTPFSLPATHALRMTQWADSWVQQFRNDSKTIAPEIPPNLPLVSLLEETANAELVLPPQSGS